MSPLDRWGIVSDAFAFLVSQRISFSDYLDILERFMDEEEDLPAREVSDQLSLLNLIVPSKVAETSRRFHALRLKRLESRDDENGRMLRGIVAGRLAMVDDAYSRELGARFLNYDAVEPDMRDAVALAVVVAVGLLAGPQAIVDHRIMASRHGKSHSNRASLPDAKRLDES